MTNGTDIEARKLLDALEEAWNRNYALNKLLRDKEPHSQIRVDLANMKGEMESWHETVRRTFRSSDPVLDHELHDRRMTEGNRDGS